MFQLNPYYYTNNFCCEIMTLVFSCSLQMNKNSQYSACCVKFLRFAFLAFTTDFIFSWGFACIVITLLGKACERYEWFFYYIDLF